MVETFAAQIASMNEVPRVFTEMVRQTNFTLESLITKVAGKSHSHVFSHVVIIVCFHWKPFLTSVAIVRKAACVGL